MLSVRIVTTDHYLAPPVRGLDVCYSEFRGTEVKQVPVLRIYGATPTGQKTCLHVHGIFPYLYIPYDGSQPAARYLRQVATSIDKAVNIALGRANSTSQHVYSINLVSALPFYGYHESEQQFLKIYLFSPYMVKRVADLVLGGAIFNKVFQPHESHIPYNLQAFIDYNLYGMNMINLATARFRQPESGLPGGVELGRDALNISEYRGLDDSHRSSPLDIVWDLHTIPRESWLPADVERQSSCELEVDAVAADILNRMEIGANVGANPGLVALWEDERQRRREHGEDSQLSPPTSPDRRDVEWTESEAELQERLSRIIMELQPYMDDPSESQSQRSQSLTPASLVQSHHSFTQDSGGSSQDTVILGSPDDAHLSPRDAEKLEEAAVVCETSILRVVSSSQSFHGQLPDGVIAPEINLNETQDRRMVEMLAALADDDLTPTSSQSASQVTPNTATLEEADSILSQVSHPRISQPLLEGEEEEKTEDDDDERDLLELSQSAWGEEEENEEQQQETEDISLSQMGIDISGMDQSWNSSQLEEVGRPQASKELSEGEGGEEGEEILPQYDGPADDKTESQSSSKKRLGMTGPTLSSSANSKGLFSITAKNSQDTVVSFISSSKTHQVPLGLDKTRAARPSQKLLSRRVSPLDSSNSFLFDLRSPGGLIEMPGSDKKADGKRSGNKSGSPGKNSPKEACRASDAMVHLNQTGRRQAGSGAPSTSEGHARRSRAGRHDNIFASFASEFLVPVSAPEQQAPSKSASPPSQPRQKAVSPTKTPVVNDTSFQAFMQKSRARLSSTGTKGEVSPQKGSNTSKSDGRRSPRLSQRDRTTLKSEKNDKASVEALEEAMDTESDVDKCLKPQMVPRRRSSDSSSDGEVPDLVVARKHVTKTRKPSSTVEKVPKLSKFNGASPGAVNHQEESCEHVEKGSEMSDDQVSLRVDPDSDNDAPIFDQTGCDDPPDIVDLPADPTSVSDSEQEVIRDTPRETVVMSAPGRGRSRTRGSRVRGLSHGYSGRGRGSYNSQGSITATSLFTNTEDSLHKNCSTLTPNISSQTHHGASNMTPSQLSQLGPSGLKPTPAKKVPSYPPPAKSKSCVSLAERKRKLSLKKLQKQRENEERRNTIGSSNPSDSDSYTSSDLYSDSPLSHRLAATDHSHRYPTPTTPSAEYSPESFHTSRSSPGTSTLGESSDIQSSPSYRHTSSHLENSRGLFKCRGLKGSLKPSRGGLPARRITRGGGGGRYPRNRPERCSFSEDETVWVSVSNVVHYYNGMRVSLQGRKTRHMAEENLSRVRVLKEDCHAYKLTDIGQEKLDLHKMKNSELADCEKYKPKCDRLYRKYKVDTSLIRKPPGRPPGWKKQQNSFSSDSERPGTSPSSGVDVMDTDPVIAGTVSLKLNTGRPPPSKVLDDVSLEARDRKRKETITHSQTSLLPAHAAERIPAAAATVKSSSQTLKHIPSLSQSAPSSHYRNENTSKAQPSSLVRHSSLDNNQQQQQQPEKGDMSVVDFSVLENPMDNDMGGLASTDADPHRQLHTPPLLMDVDADASSQHTGSSPHTSEVSTPHRTEENSPSESTPEKKAPRERKADEQISSSDEDDDDGRHTVDDTLTETDLYSDSNVGQGSVNGDGDLSDSSRKITAIKSLVKQDSFSTEDSLASDGPSKKGARKAKGGSLKLMIRKVNSGSSTEAHSQCTEDDVRRPLKKRRKYEQSDSYKNRSKRTTVDYSSDVNSRKLSAEKQQHQTEKQSAGDKRRKRTKQKEAIHYIIINRFRGYKSMRVLLERLYIDKNQSIHLKDLNKYRKRKVVKESKGEGVPKFTGSFTCKHKTIVSDVPHENQSDPLWEAQMERLGGDNERDSGRSSDDESSQDEGSDEYRSQRAGPFGGAAASKVTKKPRVASYHKRLSNAFCGKTRRPKRKADQNKIWNTLSLLHNATVAQLTSPHATYDDGVDNDHSSEYMDVMYKLALYSPPQSEHGGQSPPQPMSPAASVEDYEALVQQQDEGPRKPHAHIKQAKAANASPSLKDDNQSDKSHSKNAKAAADSPSGSDSDAHFGRQALLSEYNSTGMNPNNTGSPYTVKEAIVRFNPSKVFGPTHKGSPCYSKDFTPPDLGPPSLHQMSPHSLGSNSGSPPELILHDSSLAANSSSLDPYTNFFGNVATGPSNNRTKPEHNSRRKSAVNTQPKTAPVKNQKHFPSRESRGTDKQEIVPTKDKEVVVSNINKMPVCTQKKDPLTNQKFKPGDASESGEQNKEKESSKSGNGKNDERNTKQTSVSSSKNKAGKSQEEVAPSTSTKGGTDNTGETTKEKNPRRNRRSLSLRKSKDNPTHEKTKEEALKKKDEEHEARGQGRAGVTGKSKQPTGYKKGVARFGVDLHAMKKQAEAKKQTNMNTEGQESAGDNPAKNDGNGKGKKEENDAHKSAVEKGEDEDDETEESSEEEEDVCVRMQSPPQSPQADEPSDLLTTDPKEVKETTSSEKRKEITSDEDSEVENHCKKQRHMMSPIRSPSPTHFSTGSELNIPIVPIATPLHTSTVGHDYHNILHSPTFPTNRPIFPVRYSRTAPADWKRRRPSIASPPRQTSPPRTCSPTEDMIQHPKTEEPKSVYVVDKSCPSKKSKLDRDRVETTEAEKKMQATLEESTEESEEESEDEETRRERHVSPIRSPSPELLSPQEEEAPPPRLKTQDVSSDVLFSTPEGPCPAAKQVQNRTLQSQSGSVDLFSPEESYGKAETTAEDDETESKVVAASLLANKDDESMEEEEEEESEEEECERVSVPIRSPSPDRAYPSVPCVDEGFNEDRAKINLNRGKIAVGAPKKGDLNVSTMSKSDMFSSSHNETDPEVNIKGQEKEETVGQEGIKEVRTVTAGSFTKPQVANKKGIPTGRLAGEFGEDNQESEEEEVPRTRTMIPIRSPSPEPIQSPAHSNIQITVGPSDIPTSLIGSPSASEMIITPKEHLILAQKSPLVIETDPRGRHRTVKKLASTSPRKGEGTRSRYAMEPPGSTSPKKALKARYTETQQDVRQGRRPAKESRSSRFRRPMMSPQPPRSEREEGEIRTDDEPLESEEEREPPPPSIQAKAPAKPRRQQKRKEEKEEGELTETDTALSTPGHSPCAAISMDDEPVGTSSPKPVQDQRKKSPQTVSHPVMPETLLGTEGSVKPSEEQCQQVSDPLLPATSPETLSAPLPKSPPLLSSDVLASGNSPVATHNLAQRLPQETNTAALSQKSSQPESSLLSTAILQDTTPASNVFPTQSDTQILRVTPDQTGDTSDVEPNRSQGISAETSEQNDLPETNTEIAVSKRSAVPEITDTATHGSSEISCPDSPLTRFSQVAEERLPFEPVQQSTAERQPDRESESCASTQRVDEISTGRETVEKSSEKVSGVIGEGTREDEESDDEDDSEEEDDEEGDSDSDTVPEHVECSSPIRSPSPQPEASCDLLSSVPARIRVEESEYVEGEAVSYTESRPSQHLHTKHSDGPSSSEDRVEGQASPRQTCSGDPGNAAKDKSVSNLVDVQTSQEKENSSLKPGLVDEGQDSDDGLSTSQKVEDKIEETPEGPSSHPTSAVQISSPRAEKIPDAEEERGGAVKASDGKKDSDKVSEEGSSSEDEDEDESSSDEEDGRLTPVSIRSPAVSIRSPSPIRSPEAEDIAEPDETEDIKSPSPLPSSDDDRRDSGYGNQPPVIPLTIDTSVGDPRVRRALHPHLPSPLHRENRDDQQPLSDAERCYRGSQQPPAPPPRNSQSRPESSHGEAERLQRQSGVEVSSGGQDERHPSDNAGDVLSDRAMSVIVPARPPPSRRHVIDTARTEGRQDGAFFSDPKDAVQQRPREVGGRTLRIPTNQVSELLEVESELTQTGLQYWQHYFITTKLSTQTGQTWSQDIMEQMRLRQQLKMSLLGNRTVVLTPTRPPPSRQKVELWAKAKSVYDQIQREKSRKTNSVKSGQDVPVNIPVVVVEHTKDREGRNGTESPGGVVEATSSRPVKCLLSKGKAGKSGKVKNPGFSKHLSWDSPERKSKSVENSRNLGEMSTTKPTTRGADLEVGSAKWDEMQNFDPLTKTPCRRTSRRSISADDVPQTPGRTPRDEEEKSPPLLKSNESARFKRRRSFDDLALPLHSTPHTVCSTPLKAGRPPHSDLPIFTPIRREVRADLPQDTPSTSVGFREKSLTTPTDLSGATPPSIGTTPERERRASGRSSTPPPVRTTPPHIPKRRSLTPPPSMTIPSGSLSDTVVEATPFSSQNVKRRCSLRRLSTGTQSFLRRVLLSSQKKNPFATQLTLQSNVSQIEGASMRNTYGFRVSMQNVKDAKALHEFQYITSLSVEVHALGRGDLSPDPSCDQIAAIFFSILNDVPPEKGDRESSGVIVVDAGSVEVSEEAGGGSGGGRAGPSRTRQRLLDKSATGQGLDITYVRNEEELVNEFIAMVLKWDPDILVGWEIQGASWGYLMRRADQLSINLCQKISRVTKGAQKSGHATEKDEYGADTMSEIHVAGRIVINLWRILRHEVTLNIYTFENVMYHVLHRRLPKFSPRYLSNWWQHRTHIYRWRVVDYYASRVKGNLQIMERIDLIGQTSEFARVFGIEFYHVLSRGSQYRVESMMMRIAKPMNLVAVSPSVQQRATMSAPECIPLTLEPQSRLYTQPVVVLDFQSLYPSIMIAYNYCYSTCLGKLDRLQKAHEGPFEFGCSNLHISPSVLKKLRKDVNVCPNGVVFLRQHVKKGIISRMVEEILKTRLMVKRAMKQYKGDRTLERLLHARQLGLKLIANVTFGYTAANYSGRMPCVEVGDSIVRKARETLERAIHLVEKTDKWKARVVYGDTDSLFICLPGRSKDEAFRIGQEIADAVTADNPKPVKLKFEKVYLPCVLQTKKRYVGYMYETVDQKDPVFDAKGIETVRRDSCSAVSKILERSLKVLFNTLDLSLVKQYVQKQLLKLLEGRADMQDFIFAKEYRGMAGYKPGATVPALEIAKQRLAQDRQAEPKVGERVPYVIVYGTPGLPLIQLVREPDAVLADPSLRLNANYYITKAILPPLDRAFKLMGVQVTAWYDELPRVHRIVPHSHYGAEQKKGTISQYFSTVNCLVCEEVTTRGVCESCAADPQHVTTTLNSRIQVWERTFSRLSQVCYSCMEAADSTLPCSCLDCPVLFRLQRAQKDLTQISTLRQNMPQVISF